MTITIENLTKQFGTVTAVNNMSVTCASGKLVALLGPSGCGKSTLLYMLAGITPATAGKIYFDDTDVTGSPPEKRGVGLVFQNYALYPHMTVLQNICFPLEIQKIPKEERLKKAQAMAEMVHIGDLLDRMPSELSGGQQQRVAITRALVKQPKLLLLDEPLSNLDARLRIEMREEIRRIQIETGVTTIFVTHDQEEAMSISDSVLLLRDGNYQQFDQPQILYDDPVNLFTAKFLGTPPINTIDGFVQGGQFFSEDRSFACAIPEGQVPESVPVVLAVRPESVSVADPSAKGAFPATVTEVYRMGKEELTYLALGSSLIRGYISRENELLQGQSIHARFKESGVFVFDLSTGERYL